MCDQLLFQSCLSCLYWCICSLLTIICPFRIMCTPNCVCQRLSWKAGCAFISATQSLPFVCSFICTSSSLFLTSRLARSCVWYIFLNNAWKMLKMFCPAHAAEWGINWEYFRLTPDRPSQPWLMDDFAACISGGVQFWKMSVLIGKLPPWIWAMSTTLRIRWPPERKEECPSMHSTLCQRHQDAVNDLFILDFARLIVVRVETWSLIKNAQCPGP